MASQGSIWKVSPLGKPDPPAVLRYGLAVVCVGISLAATYLMQPYVFRTPLFFLSIMITAWVGGAGPGLLAVSLSGASIIFILNPQGIVPTRFQNATNIIAFLLTALLVSAWSARRRRAEQSLQQARDEMEAKVQERTADLSRSNEQLQTEIGERKRTEAALRQSEDRVRLIINTIPVMTWSVRPDGVVDFLNQRWMEYAGLTLEQYVADPTGPIHPQDRQIVLEKWRAQMARGDAYDDEMRLRRADGEYRWFLVRTAPLRDEQGNIVKWYGVSTDIEDRKRAEEALRESQRKLQEAQRIAMIGYWERDLLTDRLTLSEGASRIFRLEPGRVYSRAEFEEMIHPDDRELNRRTLSAALQGKQRYDVEYRVIRPDGEVRFIHVWDEISYDESGRPVRMFGTVQDITERKRTEEALRSSEERLRLVIDTIPANAWSASPDGAVDFTNQRLLKDLGFSHQDLAGWNWTNVVHPEDLTGFLNKWRAALASHEPMEIEVRVRRADGEYLWYLIRNVPLKDDAGNVVRWYGTGVDITERKRAEEALQETSSELELILNNSPLPITGTDADGRITSWNKAAERLFGWTAEEAVGRVCPTIPPKATKEYLEMIRGVMQGETYVGLVHYRQKKGGGLLTCSISAAPQQNGHREPVGVTIIVEDITERQRAEEALRESQHLLQLMLATLPVGVVVTDQAGNIVLVNAAAKRIWGEVIVSGSQRWAQTKGFWHDSGKPIAPTAWASVRALSQGQTSLNELIDIETFDGQSKTIQNSAAPIRNAEGRIVGAVIVNEDVTERVRAEEQLKRSNEELRALSARLHSVREEESTRIAREIHDELGAALSSLKWDLEEIDEVMSETTDPTPRAALRKKVASLIMRTDSAVDAIRRIASELRPTALEEFGLAEALRWHAEQFQARTGIVVTCDCRLKREAFNHEQSTAIFRIVQEALTNVLRHAQATRVDIKIRHEGDLCVLTIRDNGRGITEAEKSGPQALGLLGMRERTHLLGGEIRIEGAEDRGTMITVRVPARDLPGALVSSG
ncbi:MAG TPA: PAS domain S-box protein [Blastocatellia bacterium]|nr:PAS domain S-box protein [Blastocatellia bacterium]